MTDKKMSAGLAALKVMEGGALILFMVFRLEP